MLNSFNPLVFPVASMKTSEIFILLQLLKVALPSIKRCLNSISVFVSHSRLPDIIELFPQPIIIVSESKANYHAIKDAKAKAIIAQEDSDQVIEKNKYIRVMAVFAYQCDPWVHYYNVLGFFAGIIVYGSDLKRDGETE
jgi:hypothetical protein